MLSIDISMMIIRLMFLYYVAVYENVKIFTPHDERGRKNLNPLSSVFDTIITKDFHCSSAATSAD